MKSWRDDDLILFRYGEHPRAGEIRRALGDDPGLARRYAELERTLALLDVDAEPPEPPPGWDAALWRRLRPQLEPRRPRWPWFADIVGGWRLAALAGAALVLLAVGYLAGRRGTEGPAPDFAAAAPAARSAPARERLLLASIGGHLDASARLLTDLANAPAGAEAADERAWAESLLAANRLYRQAATRAGQRRIVALLDELEPVLLELAHAPAAGDLDDLRRQVEGRDLLFKVRVVGARLAPENPGSTRL